MGGGWNPVQPQMRLLQKPEPPRSPVTVVWVVHKRGRTQTVAFFPTCTLAEGRTSPAWALRAAATTACLDARSDCEPLPPPSQISRELTSCHHHLPILQQWFQTTSAPITCPGGPPELLLPSRTPGLGTNPLIYKPLSKIQTSAVRGER